MPFKSEKQRKWMHANKPAMAKRWEKEEKNKGKSNTKAKKSTKKTQPKKKTAPKRKS